MKYNITSLSLKSRVVSPLKVENKKNKKKRIIKKPNV